MSLLSYSKGITKKSFVAELRKHQKHDDFVRGSYWNGEKGCAVGCSIKSIAVLKKLDIRDFAQHQLFEAHLGIPEWLARVEDTLFEGMSLKRSKSWPVDFAKAIPEGVDLSPVQSKFAVIVLTHSLESMSKVKYDETAWPQVKSAIEQCKKAVEQTIELHKSESARSAAESAAWSAAESARSAAWSARSAAESAAWSAAWSARSARSAARSAAWSAWSAAESAESAARSAAESARSARSAAESAAESAARSAAESAWSARSAAYDFYADELLKVLKGLK
jgi:hypothetical protein